MAKPDVVGLLAHIIPQLEALKVKIIMRPTEFVYGDSLGYWDPGLSVIEISIHDPGMWPTVLAHEYGHVLQNLAGRFLDQAPWDVFSEFLKTGKSDARALKRAVRCIQAAELEAERTALSLARMFSLCDEEDYIRKANDYIFKHEFARRHGFWPKESGFQATTPKKLISASAFAQIPRESEVLWLDRGR